MDATELIAWTRAEATVSANSRDYTSDVILGLLNKNNAKLITPLIANCRSGYWYHTVTRTLGAGNPFVRLPPRACAFEQMDVSFDGGRCWEPLSEALEQEAQDWENEHQSRPTAYVIRGSTAVLIPAATNSTTMLRAKVVLKPSVIYTSQAGGIITDIDYDTRTLTLTSLPINKLTNSPISGTTVCDAIEPRNCFELSLFDAACTVVDSTHVTVAAGPSLLRMEVGDALRVANQSDWPQMMDTFHHLLGSAAAIPICKQRELYERADNLQAQVETDLERYANFLKPRVRVGQHTPIQHSWEPD